MNTAINFIRRIGLVASAIAIFALATTQATAADKQPAEKKAKEKESAEKAVAEPKPVELNPVGKPKNMEGRKRHDCYIWYVDGWWHIRGSDQSKQSVFYQGSVEIDGGEIAETSWAGIDKRKNKKVRDWVAMDRNNKGFKFLFRNVGGGDTVSFRVSESAKTVKFSLTIDRDSSPENIRVGPPKAHPATNPFILPAHPQAAAADSADTEKPTDPKDDQTKPLLK